MNNFWESLKKPIFVLAPMADVTDVAFRRIIAKYGKPDVMWTEFVACDGLYATREKVGMKDEENPLMQSLLFDTSEHPIVAQLFTSNPETMEYSAKLCAELGFDGIDINMGCPDRSIEKQGAGAAHMKDADTAKKVIAAAKKSGLPVSVKTRIGYNKEEIDTWIPELLSQDLAALTVHLRTRKEMSKVGVPAFLVAILGVALPFAGGFFASKWLLPGLDFNPYLFIGATLTATSVGITARVFQDLKFELRDVG